MQAQKNHSFRAWGSAVSEVTKPRSRNMGLCGEDCKRCCVNVEIPFRHSPFKILHSYIQALDTHEGNRPVIVRRMLRRKQNTDLAINSEQDTTHLIDANMVVCAIDVASLQGDSRQQEIQLIPQDANGRIEGMDGRSWLMDADALIANAQLSKTDFPIDYNHASLDARKTGASAPAAGWVDRTSLQAKDDGIYGTVEWNKPAINHLVEREFRYTSPVFTFDPLTKKTLAYKGSGLTHYPNLGNLKPVVNTQASNNKENSMDEIIEEIREALNLPTASNAAEIKTELDKLFARAGTLASNSEASLTDQLGLIETRITTAETKATEAVAANSKVDATQFVPRAEFDRVDNALKTITTTQENNRVETAVNDALRAGKITPASLDWAKDYCRKDAEGFSKFVSNTAQVIPMGEDKHGDSTHGAALSAEETAVCAQLGLSTEDFLKAKKTEEGA